MNLVNNDAAVLSAIAEKFRFSRQPIKPEQPKPKCKIWDLPGFGGKSRVLTSFGQLPIEALRVRDRLKTPSGAYVEVKWIDKIKLDAEFLEDHPHAHPVFVPQDALGRSQPENSILVSPAQKLKTPGFIGSAQMHCASTLVGKTRVSHMPQSEFIYYLFHCGTPTVVSIEGLWFDLRP